MDELTYLNDRFGDYLATGVLLWAGPAYLATRSASASLAASADTGPGQAGKGGSPLTRPAALTAGAAALAVAALAVVSLLPGDPDTEEHRPVRARSSSTVPYTSAPDTPAPAATAPSPPRPASTPPSPAPATARPSAAPAGVPLAACTGFDADDGELKPAADEHDVPRSVGLDAQLPRRLARGQLPDARQRCQGMAWLDPDDPGLLGTHRPGAVP
ncbi:hypothetical protein ABZ173_31745 [Streptomyces rochei]|uniref:hypothetical protein n=1 Tax=Streptomyces rochei TaxID=1928 RepID=UPI0033A289DC